VHAAVEVSDVIASAERQQTGSNAVLVKAAAVERYGDALSHPMCSCEAVEN